MSSLDLKLFGTIFSFPIGWAKTKIFEFEDFGLEVERSQPVGPKISKWVFSHLFPLDHRTHRNRRNHIWMSITHFINIRKSTNCQCRGEVKSHKKIAWKLQVMKILWKLEHELDSQSSCDSTLKKYLTSQTC